MQTGNSPRERSPYTFLTLGQIRQCSSIIIVWRCAGGRDSVLIVTVILLQGDATAVNSRVTLHRVIASLLSYMFSFWRLLLLTDWTKPLTSAAVVLKLDGVAKLQR